MLSKLFFSKRFPLSFFFLTVLILSLSGCSEDDELVVVRPENRLDAQAGTDQNVLINTPVTLDASASRDGNGKPFEYRWELKNKPAGSNTSIENALNVTTQFTPDKPGIYCVYLSITQGSFSDSDELTVIATQSDNPEEPHTILISNDITEETTLTDIFADENTPDYIVTVHVQVRAPLIVEPGVNIEFEQDRSLRMMLGGSLTAEGTASRPVKFTGTQKQEGFWQGLLFATNSDLNRLEHVIVEFGGSSELPESPRANIAIPGDAISGSVLHLSNTTVHRSGGYGLYIGGQSYVSHFDAITLTDNAGAAIYASPKNISRIDSHTAFSGNGFNGVETGGTLNEGVLVSWRPLEYGGYKVTSDLTIASGLEIGEGTILRMAKNVLLTIDQSGFLSANGSPGSKIVFEGTSTVGENAWRGILFRSAMANSMDHTIVRNAGFTELPHMSTFRANIGVATGATVSITNSLLEKSGGWGIALEDGSLFNEDIHTSNSFTGTPAGTVRFPKRPQPVDITGEWVDYNSFFSGNLTINTNFYNRQTGEWFEGAVNPWVMSPKTGFGLKVDESGDYVWTMAVQHSPMTGCFTYSAEHFTGTVSADGELLHFVELSWRSKYFNSCSPGENMDFDVQPGQMQLPYEVSKEFNVFTGEEYWVLSVTSGSETFKLYRQ
jgi:hypothetical protein